LKLLWVIYFALFKRDYLRDSILPNHYAATKPAACAAVFTQGGPLSESGKVYIKTLAIPNEFGLKETLFDNF